MRTPTGDRPGTHFFVNRCWYKMTWPTAGKNRASGADPNPKLASGLHSANLQMSLVGLAARLPDWVKATLGKQGCLPYCVRRSAVEPHPVYPSLRFGQQLAPQRDRCVGSSTVEGREALVGRPQRFHPCNQTKQ